MHSWTPNSGVVPKLAASACINWWLKSASSKIVSTGTARSASSSKPAFSYLTGVSDNVKSMFWKASAGDVVGGTALSFVREDW